MIEPADEQQNEPASSTVPAAAADADRLPAMAFVPLRSRQGRLIVAATVLGSGTAFVEMTVVNVALPGIARDLRLGIAGLQWVMDGYLLTLSALMLLGGSLGDRYGRGRVFVSGLLAFALASLLAALAPTVELLVAVRLIQGAAAALLVPNSLAILETTFAEEDRGRAIGYWAGWSAVSTALGPLLGGWLVDAASWRAVFATVTPLALAAAALGWHSVPAAPRSASGGRVDYLGATLVTLGFAGILIPLITVPGAGASTFWLPVAGIAGVLLLVWFVVHEMRAAEPLVPLGLFRSRTFTGANLTTLCVYAALSGLFFLLMLQLQNGLGMSALAAGAALLPVNGLMLLGSPMTGQLASRIGARGPMALGATIAGLSLLLFMRVQPGTSYVGTLLPAVLLFGLGLTMLVAPLTGAALAAAPQDQKGIASAFNNAVARLAGLVATAALPLAAGMGGLTELQGDALTRGYVRGMQISSVLCFAGAAIAWFTMKEERGSSASASSHG